MPALERSVKYFNEGLNLVLWDQRYPSSKSSNIIGLLPVIVASYEFGHFSFYSLSLSLSLSHLVKQKKFISLVAADIMKICRYSLLYLLEQITEIDTIKYHPGHHIGM